MKVFYSVKVRDQEDCEFLIFKNLRKLRRFIKEFILFCKKWTVCCSLIENKVSREELEIIIRNMFEVLKRDYANDLVKPKELVLKKNVLLKPVYTIKFKKLVDFYQEKEDN